MQRRAFLKKLGFGAAAVVAAPIAIEAVCTCAGGFKPLIGTSEEWCSLHGTPLTECMPVLKQFADYTDFSAFANCQEIDNVVMQTAAELGKQFGERLSNLYASAV